MRGWFSDWKEWRIEPPGRKGHGSLKTREDPGRTEDIRAGDRKTIRDSLGQRTTKRTMVPLFEAGVAVGGGWQGRAWSGLTVVVFGVGTRGNGGERSRIRGAVVRTTLTAYFFDVTKKGITSTLNQEEKRRERGEQIGRRGNAT